MRKIFVSSFIILVFMLTGCSKGSTTIKSSIAIKDTISVNYKNVFLLEDDMNDIIDEINDVDFDTESAIDVLKEDTSPLIIEADNVKYEFVFVDGSICYKPFGATTGSYTCGKTGEIESDLDELYDTYTSENFSITFNNNYTKDDGTIVNYENTDESIIIVLNEEVNSLSIYKSEVDEEGNVISGDVIYKIENVSGKTIIKTTPSEAVPKMLIRIVNKYGVSFVYMPTYNGKTGEIDFYSPASS